MKVKTNISLDANLKKEAISLFADFGLDLSTAISLFLSQSVREQKIPFEIKRNVPNAITLKAIEETEEMEKHPNNYKTFKDVDSLNKDLLG